VSPAVDSYIVGRIKNALDVLKPDVAVEDIRQEYRHIMTAIAPVLVSEGNPHGMGRAVARRLEIDRQSSGSPSWS
jgi:hypothetical protein